MEETISIKVTVQFNLNQEDIQELSAWGNSFKIHSEKLKHHSDLYDSMPMAIQRLLNIGKEFSE